MILLIFFLEALLGAVALGFFLPVSPIWARVLIAVGGFFGIFLALNILYILVLLVWSLFLGHREAKKDSPFYRALTVRTIAWIFGILRIRVTLEGKEKVPDCPIVLVSNHRSDFDPMAALVAFPKRKLAYISKPSNLKIPIAGAFVLRCSFLSINRENPREALGTLKKAAKLIREQGLDIGIYPEGTRSYRGGPKPFKEGAFLMAKQAGAPIVLMTTEGTESIAGRVIFHRNHVKLRVIEVLSAEEVATKPARALMQEAEEILFAALNTTPEEVKTAEKQTAES